MAWQQKRWKPPDISFLFLSEIRLFFPPSKIASEKIKDCFFFIQIFDGEGSMAGNLWAITSNNRAWVRFIYNFRLQLF